MIGLMDCNNFFVSCERLFRPDLRKRPVAVLSSNDGCVVARSQEVKDLGISMGAPHFQIQDLCEKHKIILFSSNLTLYRDISRRVMSALKEEFGEIEEYSIDEAFFKVPESFTGEDIHMARRNIVIKTGIPVSFGIAPTKTMAKIANGIAKKGDGVSVFLNGATAGVYNTMTCGMVWGIGAKTSKRLSELGVSTIHDFLEKGLPFARQEFGVVGERLFLELTGVSTESRTDSSLKQVSIMSTRSFKTPITDKSTLMSALGYHITEVAEKLRKQEVKAKELRIICAPSRFGAYVLRTSSGSQTFEVPTNSTVTLLKSAERLLETLFEKGVPYKKAGVVVSGLIPESSVPISLFEDGATEKSDTKLDVVIDSLNERFGKGSVRSGIVNHVSKWAPKAHFRSPCYTTKWQDIMQVKAI
jgi:DNA polymerase V